MSRYLGSCSLCGGRVTVPAGAWYGVHPPLPMCEGCGARPKNPGPVIPMEAPIRPMKPIDQWKEQFEQRPAPPSLADAQMMVEVDRFHKGDRHS